MSSNQETGPNAGETAPHRKNSEHSEVSRTEVENISRDNTMDGGRPTEHHQPSLSAEDKRRLEASAKLENPLAGLSASELARRGEEFCAKHGLTEEEDVRAFRIGAVIAGNMNRYDAVEGLTEREREVLDREITHKWSNPGMLYAVIV
jgi:hypothetical protein